MKTGPGWFFAVFFGPETGYKPVQTGPNLQIYYINSINYITWIYYIIILLIIKALRLAFQAREGLRHVEMREGGVVVDGTALQLAFRAREGWWWPPSHWNARGRGCGGWTTPLSCILSEGGVVVASVVSKRKRGMDNPSGSHFERGRGGGGLRRVETWDGGVVVGGQALSRVSSKGGWWWGWVVVVINNKQCCWSPSNQ